MRATPEEMWWERGKEGVIWAYTFGGTEAAPVAEPVAVRVHN